MRGLPCDRPGLATPPRGIHPCDAPPARQYREAAPLPRSPDYGESTQTRECPRHQTSQTGQH